MGDHSRLFYKQTELGRDSYDGYGRLKSHIPLYSDPH